MCRLCAITTTRLFNGEGAPIDIKAQLMHECMMRSAHEEGGQKDGWGVTDLTDTWKSTDWYFEDTPVWMKHIQTDSIIMSHLRKASAGTGRTVRDNHPYTFDVAGEPLTAAHNGFFDGAGYISWSANTPNTDSFRALTALAEMLTKADDHILSADLVSDWLSAYTDASHYALMLHWRNALYILRGATRTLHGLALGNGYLIHTSVNVLQQMRRYVKALHGVETPEPVIVPINTLIRMHPGDLNVTSTSLTICHARVQTHTTQWSMQYPKQEVTVPVLNQGSDTSGGDNYVIAPSVTPRRARTETALTTVLVTRPSVSALTLKERKQRWAEIAGKLAPLRGELSAFWAANALRYVNEVTREPLPHSFRMYASSKEFDLIDAILLPRTVDNKFIKPFSPVALAMINWWNHLVVGGQDQAVHMRLFGTRFFWLNTRYTRMKDADGKFDNAAAILPIWTSDVLRLIEQYVTAGEIAKFFDTKMLRAIVDEGEKRDVTDTRN